MALINCSECGGDISTEADACPHCGAPSPKQRQEIRTKQRNDGIKGLATVVGFILIVWVIHNAFNGESTSTTTTHDTSATATTTATTPAARQPTRTYGSADFNAIVEASQHNEPRFDRDYKGQWFAALGTLHTVGEGGLFFPVKDKVEVWIVYGRTAYCYLTLDHNTAASWPANMPIEISGTIDDTVLGSLRLENCAVTPR